MEEVGAKVTIFLGAAVLVGLLSAAGHEIYKTYDDKKPHHGVGDCIKLIDNEGNEFEETTYEYAIITKVGKHMYRYIQLFHLKNSGWLLSEDVSSFYFIDGTRGSKLVNCNEVIPLLKDIK